jgi:biotin carboxyl carrier protein
MARVDVLCEMTGTVMEVLVAAGDKVAAEAELLIIESMKMEIPVESPVAGIIDEVLVAPEQRVNEGDLLFRIET